MWNPVTIALLSTPPTTLYSPILLPERNPERRSVCVLGLGLVEVFLLHDSQPSLHKHGMLPLDLHYQQYSLLMSACLVPSKLQQNNTVSYRFIQRCNSSFTVLWNKSADDTSTIFLFFSQKIGFDISCKLSPVETIYL